MKAKEVDENNYARVTRIVEGLKIFMPNEKSCLQLEKALNNVGIKTRSGRNWEVDLWSIYIIAVPDKLVGTNKTI